MKWFLVIIIPLLVYIGLGWIVSDIYLSFQNVGEMSIFEYENIRLWIYNIVATVYIFIINAMIDFDQLIDANSAEDYFIWFLIALPLIMAFVMQYIPISVGAALLNFIICILDMWFCSAMLVSD